MIDNAPAVTKNVNRYAVVTLRHSPRGKYQSDHVLIIAHVQQGV
jgi:hypothetical protein